MACNKCFGKDVLIINETEMKRKQKTDFNRIVWNFLVIITFGLIPSLKKKKIKPRSRTIAICQKCGERWFL